ncbi:DUF6464 family protein [Nostoc sp.]|uniref:DUF6464 family protein n=1 Tax=Nostoc sp. TaxID=1180 RepID=UPI003FA5F7BA
MNQNEIVEECSYTLRLWSDAVYEVDTSQIKSLLNLVTQRLGFYSQIDARYYQIDRRWQVRFCWYSESSGRQSFEQILDGSQLVCAKGVFLEHLARDIGDRIRKTIPNDDHQNWVIVRWREGFLAGIHQAGKRSVNLILHELTQEGDLTTNYTGVTIRAWMPGNAIKRGGSVEIDGMLLQGELLGWVEEPGQEGWFLFSPNTQQVNTSCNSSDETRITFTTRPRTARLAAAQALGLSMEDMGQMIEQGQIELLRSGYFDRWLESPPYLERPIELPRLRRGEEVIIPSTEIISGRWHRYDDIHADSEYEGLGLRTCKYNARSRMLRCAVNPCGPCEGCSHYEKI